MRIASGFIAAGIVPAAVVSPPVALGQTGLQCYAFGSARMSSQSLNIGLGFKF